MRTTAVLIKKRGFGSFITITPGLRYFINNRVFWRAVKLNFWPWTASLCIGTVLRLSCSSAVHCGCLALCVSLMLCLEVFFFNKVSLFVSKSEIGATLQTNKN